MTKEDFEMNSGKIDNVWVADGEERISYPEDGYETCFQVEDRSFWFRYRNQVILSFLAKEFAGKKTENIRFMDLGGGNGFVAKSVQDLGYETVLVEPGLGAYNAARRGVKNVYKCSLDSYPLGDKFDVVGMFDVLEHFESPLEILLQAASMMKNDAVLLLTVPCYQMLWSKDDELAGHFRRYTWTSLRKDLNKAGFEIVDGTYFFSILLLPISLLRALPYQVRRILRKRKKSPAEVSGDLVASHFVERCLGMFFAIEQGLIKKIGRFPFGASLIVKARKKRVTDSGHP